MKCKICKIKISLVEEIANKCVYCNKTYCGKHKYTFDHKCKLFTKNIINLPNANFKKIDII